MSTLNKIARTFLASFVDEPEEVFQLDVETGVEVTPLEMDQIEEAVRAEFIAVPEGENIPFSSAEELDGILAFHHGVTTTLAAIKSAAKKAVELEVGRVMPPPFPVSTRTANPVQSANAAAMKLRRRHSISGRVEIVGKTTVANGWATKNPGRVAMMVDDDLAALCQQRGRQ